MTKNPYSVGFFVVDGEIVEVRGEAEALKYGREHGGQVYWDRALAENHLRYGDAVTAREVEAREALAAAGLTDREINLWHFGMPGVPHFEVARAMAKASPHETPPWLGEV